MPAAQVLVSLEKGLKMSVAIRSGAWELLQRAEHRSKIALKLWHGSGEISRGLHLMPGGSIQEDEVFSA